MTTSTPSPSPEQSEDVIASESSPTVVISGGGPAGLLAAILLGRAGIRTTVIERAPEPDQWSSKSYSIVLQERGQAALKAVGEDVLDAVQTAGMERRHVFIWDCNAETGAMKTIPKSSVGIGISRPLLIECLEHIAAQEATVTIQRGSGVSAVHRNTDSTSSPSSSEMFRVELEDGSTSSISASHIIGADGKWSQVRQSFPELDRQAKIQVEPSFGVHMMASSVPEGWPTDGTHVLRPLSPAETFYVIAAPLPTGGMSTSLVCFDTTVEKHPWLEPPADLIYPTHSFGNNDLRIGGWEEEYSARPEAQGPSDATLIENLTNLLETEMPLFLSAVGHEALATARINRRTSWLEMTPVTASSDGDVEQEVSYATNNGRVALIGDAAHAVTPSLGDGCNMALESAVKLLAPLLSHSLASSSSSSTSTMITDALLSKVFLEYGRSRPKETQPLQVKAATMSRGKTNGRM
jgi:2-polyprenyl-6-methoxyphenol hydroxylase-like FAD-dependent oxidoreductase